MAQNPTDSEADKRRDAMLLRALRTPPERRPKRARAQTKKGREPKPKQEES